MTRRGLLLTALVVASARMSFAQTAPAADWRTIATEHFRVHFTPGLEGIARRAAGEAERAWTRLASELHTPRTPIDLVVADTRDVANGQANYFPSNRITIWAHPPIENASLRFSDDWIQQVVTHELAHIFHLDRTRGLWRVAQLLFGRHPALFPNARSPRWLTEGIAIAYESKASGGGRLNGAELHATMETWSARQGTPAPGKLSLATPYWPVGDLAYFAGAQLVDAGETRGGDSALRRFIDRVAVFPVPYLWDLHARSAFGASFRTLARTAGDSAQIPVAAPLQMVAGPYWELRAPRWSGDSILFTASGPRNVTGLYRVRAGDVRRVARRNNVDAFGVVGNRIVHAELEFTDPYHLFSALYVDGDHREEAGRISAPDVRADDTIVGVETDAGAARLVLFDATGRRLRELTRADPDTQWSAPRWSRAGDAIAAIRWMRGGDSEVVVLSENGDVIAVHARARAVQTNPSWDADDAALFFVSDRGGWSSAYRVSLTGADSGVVRRAVADSIVVTDAEASPDGTRLAVVRMTPSGHELAIVPVIRGDAAVRVATSVFAAGLDDPIVTAGGNAGRYLPLRTLLPRYWIPTAGTSARDEYTAGFFTSGSDVIGRHRYTAEGLWDVESGEFYGTGTWSYYGFGRPVLDVAVNQSWTIFPIANDANVRLGEVTRRNRTVALTTSWIRARVRSVASLAVGGEYEWRRFETHPDALRDQLDPPPPDRLRYPSLLLAAGWSASRRSSLGLGPEDGLAVSATARRRWRTDDPDATTAHSVIARTRGFISLPLPGHARHVLAASIAGGWAEPQTNSVFSGGGVSGTSLELLPGYRIGDSQRSFPVRGFAAGSVSGIRAWGASAEYRAPLFRIGRGLWPLPFYFQRSSLSLFGDAASAWCPVDEATAACPNGETSATTIASVGGELQLDATVEYDTPNRFRLGVAFPVHGPDPLPKPRVYFTLGAPF